MQVTYKKSSKYTITMGYHVPLLDLMVTRLENTGVRFYHGRRLKRQHYNSYNYNIKLKYTIYINLKSVLVKQLYKNLAYEHTIYFFHDVFLTLCSPKIHKN